MVHMDLARYVCRQAQGAECRTSGPEDAAVARGGLGRRRHDKPLTLDFTVVEKNERSITITIELAML